MTSHKLASTPKITSFFKFVGREEHESNMELDRAQEKLLHIQQKRKKAEALKSIQETLAADMKRQLDAEGSHT